MTIVHVGAEQNGGVPVTSDAPSNGSAPGLVVVRG